MKAIRLLTLFLLLFGFLTACDKKKEEVLPDNGANTSVGKMTAKVNGVSWASSTAYAAQVNTYGLTIIGQFNNEAISITTNAVIKPGRFSAFSYKFLNGAFAINNGSTTQLWTTINNKICDLNITKLDWDAKKVSGTFSFKADSQGVAGGQGIKTITEGVFTDLPLSVTVPLNFSATAQVNNSPWIGSGMYITGFPGYYELQTTDTNGNFINISGFNSLQPGTYQAGFGLYSEYAISHNLWWSTPKNAPPTITIAQFDPVAGTASGTFSFTGEPDIASGQVLTGTKNITQGTFTNIPVF